MTKILCDGRLVVEPYPTEKKIKSEASREDCSSSLFIHIDINHDSMSTVELYNLLRHNYTIHYLRKHYRDKNELMDAFEFKILQGLPDLNDRHDEKKDWTKPENFMNWYDSQLEIWEGRSDKFHYGMWINWCKNILKKKSRWLKEDHKTEYNPYESLRLRVRTEFHD
jgi:hypothetical protein